MAADVLRRPWLFRSLGLGPDDVFVTLDGDETPREDFERLTPSLAYFLLNDWVTDDEHRSDLEDVWYELTGERISLRCGGAPRELALRRLVDAFEEERLLLWGPIREGVQKPAIFGERPPKDRPHPEAATTWIEILLLDQANVPIAGEPYELTLVDGSRRSGQLDDRGMARLDGLEAGVCDVSFPRIDGKEWSRA